MGALVAPFWAQILNASGWRPDNTQPQNCNIVRSLPPRPKEGAPLKSMVAGILDTGDPEIEHLTDAQDLTRRTGIVVYASAFFQRGCGVRLTSSAFFYASAFVQLGCSHPFDGRPSHDPVLDNGHGSHFNGTT